MSYCSDLACYEFVPCPNHPQTAGEAKAPETKGESAAEAAFRAAFQGVLLKRGDPDGRNIRVPKFQLAREADPLWWAVVKNEADIQLSVNFARANNLRVNVCSAGQHSWHSQTDNMLVDLRDLKGIQVDEAKRRVTFKMGHTLGEIDKETDAHGKLHVPMGVVSHTGCGLVLGGGVGFLCRTYGLTADHITGGKVVLSNGEISETTESRNLDLLLSLRGGGGLTGIVTEITARAFPVPHSWVRVLALSIDQMVAQYPKLRDFYSKTSTDKEKRATTYIAFTFSPDQKRIAILLNVFIGPEDDAKAFFGQLDVEHEAVLAQGPIPFTSLQSMNDAGFPCALWYSSAYTTSLPFIPEELFKEVAEVWKADTGVEMGGIMLEQRGGAFGNDSHTTLVADRNGKWDVVCFLGNKDASGKAEKLAHFRKIKARFAHYEFLRDAKVPNMQLVDKIEDHENTRELQRLKQKFDPIGLFGTCYDLSVARSS